MTYTEQRLAKIAEHIYTLRSMARGAGVSQANSKILVGEAQQVSESRFEAERKALLRAFRDIGCEVAALPDSFRDNHPEVPWSAMAAWADDSQFPDSSFSLSRFQQWLQVAITAKAAIIHHTGAETKIQQAVMAQNDRRTDALARQWRNTQAAPHIFLWVAVVIIGAWFSTLSLLDAVPTAIESSLLAILALSCITMIRAARPTQPTLFQFFISEPARFHTFAELYDKALEYHGYNVRNLKLEIASGSGRWKRRELQWALATIFFIAAAIAARICSIP